MISKITKESRTRSVARHNSTDVRSMVTMTGLNARVPTTAQKSKLPAVNLRSNSAALNDLRSEVASDELFACFARTSSLELKRRFISVGKRNLSLMHNRKSKPDEPMTATIQTNLMKTHVTQTPPIRCDELLAAGKVK